MFAVAYILLVSGLFVLVFRYAPEPRISRDADPFVALMLLGGYVIGGAAGFYLPETIAQAFSMAWGDSWLERAARIFGAIGGFMIAVRGTLVWVSIVALGGVGLGLITLFDYIFKR